MIKNFLQKRQQEKIEENIETYKKEVNEKAERMQDWIFPIMTVVSLGGIEKNIEIFEKTPCIAQFFVGLYGFVIILILLGLYIHIKQNVKLVQAKDILEQYKKYETVFKYFVSRVLDFAFWILVFTLIFNYIFYVYKF